MAPVGAGLVRVDGGTRRGVCPDEALQGCGVCAFHHGGADLIGVPILRAHDNGLADRAAALERLPLGLAYLNEFTFRFNRRFYPFNAFRSLLGIAGDTSAPTYAELYSGEWRHPTCSGHGR